MTIHDLSAEEVLVSWDGRTWAGERTRIAREVSLEVHREIIRGGSATTTTTTEEKTDMTQEWIAKRQRFLGNLAGALKEIRRETEAMFDPDFWRENCQDSFWYDGEQESCWIDVRLQALPDPEAEDEVSWGLYSGDPQGDGDRRGFWGQTSLRLWTSEEEQEGDLRRASHDLLSQVLDMWTDCLQEGEEGPPAWLL
jgi:hypothetical protein